MLRVLYGALALALLALPAATSGADPQGAAFGGVPLAEVIRDFEKSLADAQAQIVKRGMPRMRKVEITLQTLLGRESVGGAQVRVYTVEMPWNEERSQEVTLSMVRAPDASRYETASAAASSARLVENLVALSDASRSGQERSTGMRMDELASSLRFIVVRAGSRSSFEIVPVSPSLELELEGHAVHALEVVFGAESR